MKAYIASPFFTKEQLADLDELRNYVGMINLDVYFPSDSVNSKGYSNVISNIKNKAILKYHQKLIFDDNIEAIDNSKELLANIGYYDSGTAFEVGYALASNKSVSLFGKYDYDLLSEYKSAVEEMKQNISSATSHSSIISIHGVTVIILAEYDPYLTYQIKKVIVLGESEGKYRAISKVLLGCCYFILRNKPMLTFIDTTQHKSNIMLLQACNIRVAKTKLILNENQSVESAIEYINNNTVEDATVIGE